MMLYRLFIYRSSAARGFVTAVGMVNHALKMSSACRKPDAAARYMEHFDAQRVKSQIETELGEKCKVSVCFLPSEDAQVEYLFIATSYDRAPEVLPRLYAVAAESRLALYDAETDRSYYKDLIDDPLIALRIRAQELKDLIKKETAPVWRIRKLSEYRDDWDNEACFAVTLRKTDGQPFKQRVGAFYRCLKNGLRADEELVCENRAFTVKGEWYTLTFTLEGYKKHANTVGYYENGVACQAPAGRMGVEQAFKWIEGCTDDEKEDIQSRMDFLEMRQSFPNPADRLANSVRITKWQRKQVFGVRYGGIGPYGSEILFHIVPEGDFPNAKQVSALKIEEESASFILPFIDDVYPHFYERYYLTENHLPVEMWFRILNRIKEAREMIVNDTYDPALADYVRSFNLYVFDKADDPRPRGPTDGRNEIDLVYGHRYEIAYLYEIFIQWSETQIRTHCGRGEDRMFNVQGP